MHHGWRSVPLGISLGRDPESRQRILAAGIPYVAGVTALEEAQELLATAARIEHGMAAEYLRAAYAAKDPRVAQILTSVAGEEVQHLLTMQNLRLLVGAEPNLERQSYGSPLASEPFPLLKDEFSLDSLARYVCCEAPPFNQVREDQRMTFGKARRSWSEAAPFVNRVGALYAKIYWLFLDDDRDDERWRDLPVDLLARDDAGRHVPEPRPVGLSRQLASADWPGVLSCSTKKDARSAILEIAGKGEGGPAQHASHFDQLLEAYAMAEAADALRFDGPSAALAEPTLDALYNSWICELVLALALDPNEASQGEGRLALLRMAFDDWQSLTNLARAGLRAAPHFELTAPTSGDPWMLREALNAAYRALERSLDSMPNRDSSSWASHLRLHVGARQALAIQLRAMF